MSLNKSRIARTSSRRRVSSLVGNRITLAQLIREVQTPETPDVCLHFGINWRALEPAMHDGRLHATCSCGAHVTRSAFAAN
jgi:hypothetical protein